MAWIAEQLLTAIGQAAPAECITETRLVEITGMDAKQVENACGKLIKHGLIQRVQRVGPGCHQITAAGREALSGGHTLRSGPNGQQYGKRIFTDTLRMRVWSALRLRGKASVPDLVMLVARGGEREAAVENNIHKYLRALAKAGYIVKLARREPGVAITSNGFARWFLIRDTGPKAPVWRPAKNTVYDQNTEEETPI